MGVLNKVQVHRSLYYFTHSFIVYIVKIISLRIITLFQMTSTLLAYDGENERRDHQKSLFSLTLAIELVNNYFNTLNVCDSNYMIYYRRKLFCEAAEIRDTNR